MSISCESAAWFVNHMSLIHYNRQRVHVQKRTRGDCLEKWMSGCLYDLCRFQRRTRSWDDGNDISVEGRGESNADIHSASVMRPTRLWHLHCVSQSTEELVNEFYQAPTETVTSSEINIFLVRVMIFQHGHVSLCDGGLKSLCVYSSLPVSSCPSGVCEFT